MDNKLVIFTVLASLVFSQVLSSTSEYGLTEEQEAILSQITTTREAAILAKQRANNPLYDMVVKLAAEWIFDLTSDTDLFAGISTAVDRTKNVTDSFLDSIPLIRGEACSAVEDARDPLYDITDELLTQFRAAFALAQAGNYSENLSEFETIEETILENQQNFNEILSNALVTCLEIEDTSALAVIEGAQAGSDGAVGHSAKALLNALKIYAAAVSAENKDVALFSEIENFRYQTLFQVRADIEYKFAVLEALGIADFLDRVEIVPGLSVIRYAQMVSLHQYQQHAQGFMDTINNFLTAIALGLSNTGDYDFTQIDATEAEAIAHYNAANHAILMSIPVFRPDADSSLLTSADELRTLGESVISDYFTAIKLATTDRLNASETVYKIETLRDASILCADGFVDIIYSAILGNETLDTDAECAFTIYRNDAVTLVSSILEYVYNATIILAETDSATADDFDAVSSIASSVNSLLDEFTTDLGSASFLVLDACTAD